MEAWSEQAPFHPTSYAELTVPEHAPNRAHHPAATGGAIIEVTQSGDGVSVHFDLGRWPQEPQQAVAALGRPEWSPMVVLPDGSVAQRWLDVLRQTSGITSLELVADPGRGRGGVADRGRAAGVARAEKLIVHSASMGSAQPCTLMRGNTLDQPILVVWGSCDSTKFGSVGAVDCTPGHRSFRKVVPCWRRGPPDARPVPAAIR